MCFRVLVMLGVFCLLATACGAPTASAPEAVVEATITRAAPAVAKTIVAPTQAAITPNNLPAEITLGAVHDLSGPTAVYGKAIQQGIDLAVRQVNAQKFLGEGNTLKVIYEDSSGDPRQAVTSFEKLIANPDVVVILGPTLSSQARLACPLAQQAGVPVVASSTTASGITDIGNFIFRTSLSESAIISNTVRIAKEALNLDRVAVIYGNDDALSLNGYEIFTDALAAEGIEILVETTFARGDTDFSAQLEKIKSFNPDAIVVSALTEESAYIMGQARILGIPESVHFIGSSGFNNPRLAEIAGAASEGAISGAAWHITSTVWASTSFVKSFKAEYGSDPDQFAAQAYTAAWTAAVAIKNADSVDRAAVRDTLAQITKMESPLGDFSFDEMREPIHEPVVLTVKDGSITVFQP